MQNNFSSLNLMAVIHAISHREIKFIIPPGTLKPQPSVNACGRVCVFVCVCQVWFLQIYEDG